MRCKSDADFCEVDGFTGKKPEPPPRRSEGFPFVYTAGLRQRLRAIKPVSGRATTMAVYGYARVSTEDQNLDLQRDALRAAGCEQIFDDVGVSAVAKTRRGFDNLVDVLQDGDTLIIWKLDRAFRSLRQALDVLEVFDRRGIEFRSLTDQIDTTTPMGKCMYQVRNAFAELERSLISERTKAGMEAARARGKRIGRPPVLTLTDIQKARQTLANNPDVSRKVVAEKLGISPQTLSRALNKEPLKAPE